MKNKKTVLKGVATLLGMVALLSTTITATTTKKWSFWTYDAVEGKYVLNTDSATVSATAELSPDSTAVWSSNNDGELSTRSGYGVNADVNVKVTTSQTQTTETLFHIYHSSSGTSESFNVADYKVFDITLATAEGYVYDGYYADGGFTQKYISPEPEKLVPVAGTTYYLKERAVNWADITLSPNQSWYNSDYSIEQITQVDFVTEYTPTGLENEMWYPSVSGSTDGLKAYRTDSRVTIVSNSENVIYFNANSNHMFQNCYNLVAINGLDKTNTTLITDANYMFQNCYKLKKMDTSGWVLSKCARVSYMFQNCYKLETLDTTGWNLSKCTAIPFLFMNCTSLRNVDVSLWQPKIKSKATGGASQVQYAFWNCPKLENTETIKYHMTYTWKCSESSTAFVRAAFYGELALT